MPKLPASRILPGSSCILRQITSPSARGQATVENGSDRMDLRVLKPVSPTITCEPDLCGPSEVRHLLLNIPDADLNKDFTLTIKYYAVKSGGFLDQRFVDGNGQSDYQTIGETTGDKTWRTETFTVGKPYVDYLTG